MYTLEGPYVTQGEYSWNIVDQDGTIFDNYDNSDEAEIELAMLNSSKKV
jgi:hypothetical protein